MGLAQRFQRQEALTGWTPTTVPSASNAGVFTPESYLGTVHWYRKDFRLPAGVAVLEVGAALRVGQLPGPGVAERQARSELTSGPICPSSCAPRASAGSGVNRLVVRVDSRRQKFDIPPLSQRASGAFEGGWWNYNGILREVYLRKVDQFDFAEVFFEPRLRCRTCAATVIVHAKVTNVNSRGATAAVSGTFGGRALRFRRHRVPGGGTARFRARLRIRNPRLWSPERPALYSGRLQVRTSSGRTVQRYRVRTGIRSLRVSRLGRIQLNGRDVNLRGASMHEDSLGRGAALTPGQMRQNIGYLRELGATITRSHYPFHPYTLELADRYGILMWSEIPVFRMASRLFAISEVRNKALRMLREEIVRDANHPSVAVWSIGNENASRPGTGLRKYIRKAERTVEDIDPTRLIGLATSGFPTVEKQRIYTELDVLGINDYFGWYNGPRGTISDRAQLNGYLNRLHSDYPNQALVITEFGAEANRSGPVTEKGTYEFQSEFLALPPGRVRLEAVRERGPDLEPARLPREAGVGRRQPASQPAGEREGVGGRPGAEEACLGRGAAGVPGYRAVPLAVRVLRRGPSGEGVAQRPAADFFADPSPCGVARQRFAQESRGASASCNSAPCFVRR